MTKTTLEIEGMACGMCEAHINDAVRNFCRVKKVSSSHKKGSTEIISEQPLDLTALSGVIDKTGYKVISSKSEPYVKKGLFSR